MVRLVFRAYALPSVTLFLQYTGHDAKPSEGCSWQLAASPKPYPGKQPTSLRHSDSQVALSVLDVSTISSIQDWGGGAGENGHQR